MVDGLVMLLLWNIKTWLAFGQPEEPTLVKQMYARAPHKLSEKSFLVESTGSPRFGAGTNEHRRHSSRASATIAQRSEAYEPT
ncbi:hypothetical protein PsorP6_003669 [Peronosclerospora sorghi]|uniref:Uncharacterized protein n=1 Tax=Peronosclerospora sorghi TaxID=230839 RepID=A0ACC0VND0_9STRA|nr:hypothetical protein PsorP6_003669 [Peronosclerospora sorghi]